MSYPDQPGGPYGPRDPNESQYPPPPGEEDDRARAYHQRAPSSSSVTLPAISPYDPQYAGPNGYPPPPDPRGYPQDPYRQPPPGPYGDRPPYQPEYGRPPQHMAFTQSAPRQRTAIACRYCRRRKIRCSGFEDNPSGKCSNCQRFQQDCIFTPVSSQAQAFVPAHAAYPHMRNMAVGPDGRPRMVYPQGQYPPNQQLYGAHGQPLGQIPAQATSPYSEYPMPSPTGSYSSFTEDRAEGSRKRPQAEPHPSILPPPIPGSSTSSASGLRPPQEGLPSMSRTPPPRSSPSDRSDPMSLGSIMEKRPETDIDRTMLGRLGRKGQ